MASREKKPLAPSKSKQKVNNDCGLPSNEIKVRKGKSLPNLKQQQIARNILEAVATGSQLPQKLEAALPRKKILRNLKCKQKLRVAKANLIKSKVTKKVANRSLCKISADIKKSVRTKRDKLSEVSNIKASDINLRTSENHINNSESERVGTEPTNKSAKSNLRTKKIKLVSKNSGEAENEDIQDKDIDLATGSTTKNSPKLHKKGKNSESPDSLSKSVKSTKLTGLKRNNIKEKDNCIKNIEVDIKYTKGRKSNTKDINYTHSKTSTLETKFSKSILDNKNSIDLTIEEVIASMLSDSEIDSEQEITDKIEGKYTRSKKMLVEENILTDSEIKKEPESEDIKVISDGENLETESFQGAIQSRKKMNTSINQRSLRNGKLRQSDSGISTDLELKKCRRLNSDDLVDLEVVADTIADDNTDTECCLSESIGNGSQIVTGTAKDETSFKQEASKNLEENLQTGSEVENNNNSDRLDRTNEVGPTLRSKTKARSTEVETKNDSIKVEYTKIVPRSAEIQEELKKPCSLDQGRKDSILAKFSDKCKNRRSSLNIDMKKTVNSFYGTEKSDGNSKSQIDQMIENIKLTIAKSIESKIFGPEKSHRLNKNCEVPKMEDIIAPLSAESQKLGLEENTDEDKSTISKNEIKSDSSENSVPKVADTAKEIEKLVMGDIKTTETHSQNIKKSETSDTDTSSNMNVSEVVHASESSENKIMNQQKESHDDCNVIDKSVKSAEQSVDVQTRVSDDVKKVVSTRKSMRVIDKGSAENTDNIDAKKLDKVTSKTVQPPENCKPHLEDINKHAPEEMASNSDLFENELQKKTNSTTNIDSAVELKQTQEQFIAEEIKTVEIVKDENINVIARSENTETLEGIPKEVEGFITQKQFDSQFETVTKTVENKQEINVKNSSEFSQFSNSSSTLTDTDKQRIIAIKMDNPQKVNIPDKDKVAENVKQFEISTSEETQNSEIVENDTQVPVTCNSDLASTQSSTPILEVLVNTCNSIDDSKTDISNGSENNKCKKISTIDNIKIAAFNYADDTTTIVLCNNVERCDATLIKEEDKKLKSTITEQKSLGDDKKRVLRTRDKIKKIEKELLSSSRECIDTSMKVKAEEGNAQKMQHSCNKQEGNLLVEKIDSIINTEETDDVQNTIESDTNDLERQARTRRSREFKKRKEDQLDALKNKRPKRDIRKSDQQNKEETLLDNEVAKINENNQSFLDKYENGSDCTTKFRGFSEGVRVNLEQSKDNTNSTRSKSENDLIIAKRPDKTTCKNRLSRNLSENQMTKQSESIDALDNDHKPVKTPETLQKDSDETSTSGESSSSINITSKILETPEDKAKKESILRLLGLESLEKAAERLNHQKAKKEQYTGTLKTVIRVQKEKEKDKRRSRSPLKMVLKQGRGDGEGDSPENFYTIQKEFGTSGWGDSSSGANRKFSTNHRHSCDEDNEDITPKDRQSLVIPEKSSSFSIHPGRLCADVCCYCFGKFGSLDTPMHLAQMKSDERRKKILNIERHLTKDSCLCDACYRHVDRKANTSPTNMQTKPQKQHRQLMVSKCSARDCRDAARHHVKRRWLLKIKAGLQKQVDIDWESSQHTSMSFCVSHYSKIERFLTCALCKRRLARNHTHQLVNAETDKLNQLLGQQGIPVVLAAGTFVCKLCRYFTQLQLKYRDVENMNTNHRSFFKSYRKRILHYHDIEVLENEDDDSATNQSRDKEKRKKNKYPTQSKSGTSKSPDEATNSTSEKSTPESNKNGRTNSEIENENRTAKANSNEETVITDVEFLGVENTVETLKKRKLLDTHLYNSNTTISCGNPNEVVEILAMDKEVTLTRLPKRQRTNNDITPVVQRLGANPSISVRTLFPGEEEMNLHANIEFTNVREITPQGWEKCATMIQYDRDTKLLWQELQRPYGNQSSFLRHLILLEKYYRSGDLVLAPNASRNAINYSTSVQNRLISYEGPEKMDEPIMEPIATEYHNSRRLSGGYVLERDRSTLPNTTTTKVQSTTAQPVKGSPPRVLKLNPGVSIIKKPPPNLQRLNLPSTSATTNSGVKRKDGQKQSVSAGGKVFHLSEPDFKRLQDLKKQKQMLIEKHAISGSSSSSISPPNSKSNTSQYQKTQIVAHTQFQKHLKMQQEMLNRQSRGDFEPLICDVRSLANENSPTQNLLHNLNLPKSIQVTTKMSNQIPILPKIPKSLTVIPQTVTKPAEK